MNNTYIDTENDTIYISISEKVISFEIAFNAGGASLYDYQIDPMLSDHDNLIDAIAEYEKEINDYDS